MTGTQQQISFDLYARRSVEQQTQAKMQCASFLLPEMDGSHAAISIIATFECVKTTLQVGANLA